VSTEGKILVGAVVAGGALFAIFKIKPEWLGLVAGAPGTTPSASGANPTAPVETAAYVDRSGKGWAGNIVGGHFAALEPLPLAAAPPATAKHGHAYALNGTVPDWSHDLGAMPLTGVSVPNPRAGHDAPSAAAQALSGVAQQATGAATSAIGSALSGAIGGGGGGASDAVSGIAGSIGDAFG
jgi:hypothetical protein